MKLKVVLVIIGVWVAVSTAIPLNDENQCIDRFNTCRNLATAGMCSNNEQQMRTHCPVSCNFCRPCTTDFGGTNQQACPEVTQEHEKDPNLILREAITLLHEHHVHNLHHQHEGHNHRADLYDRIKSIRDQSSQTNVNVTPNPAAGFFKNDLSVHSTVDAAFYYPDHYEETSTWLYAYCDLQPNADRPDSNVRGRIDISTREGERRGVFFDIYVSGFDVNKTGNLYGLHVHDNPVQDQKCDSTGGFYKISPNTPFPNSHPGNLGQHHVRNGLLDHVLVATIDVTFEEVIGKPIVIHSIDIVNGNGFVKDRLACCNIIQRSST